MTQLKYILPIELFVAASIVFVVLIVRGFGSAPDPQRTCARVQTGACMSREEAIVRSVDRAAWSAFVVYDDGVRGTTIYLRELPRNGEHVLLERWKGRIVSLWNPVTERRYRATRWPVRWSMDTFGAPLIFFSLMAGIAAAVFVGFLRATR